MKVKRLLSRLALAGISLLATLLVLEIGLRLFHPVDFMSPVQKVSPRDQRTLLVTASPIPGALYELRSDVEKTVSGVDVKTNHFGMRNHEPAQAPHEPEIRIAALGDSVTFGWGVDEKDAWPTALETRLNGAPWNPAGENRFEVLNFGVPGYNTVQEVALLRYKALKWKPRLIILGYILNDPEITLIDPLERSFAPTAWWQHFHLFRLLAKAERQSEIKRFGQGDFHVYLHVEGRPEWNSVVRGFNDLKVAAAQANARVLVLIFPIFPNRAGDWEHYAYAGIHQQVAGLAAGKGFDVLDLLPVLSRQKADAVALPGDNVHPNALGHQLAAAEIAEKVAQMMARP